MDDGEDYNIIRQDDHIKWERRLFPSVNPKSKDQIELLSKTASMMLLESNKKIEEVKNK